MIPLNSILLIDDDKDDNFFHERVIRKTLNTATVRAALTGPEALRLLKEENHPPDLILLDLNMPLMNGWEFLEEYGKLPPARKAKRLFILSTSNFPEDIKRSETIPDVSGYMVKPLTAEALQDIQEKYF